MDTPVTDSAKRKIEGFADEWVPRYISEELERKLAIARTALQEILDQNEYLTVNIAEHALQQIEP